MKIIKFHINNITMFEILCAVTIENIKFKNIITRNMIENIKYLLNNRQLKIYIILITKFSKL